MSMERLVKRVGALILGGLVCVVWGCSGCQEGTLDRMEDWFREDPERPGKVGTLRALEVRQNAVEVAADRRRGAQGPCDIGWEEDAPFSVEFEFQIEIEGGDASRRWSESGHFQQDAAGRWVVRNQVEFDQKGSDGGKRRVKVGADEQGFREWIGPRMVVDYGEDSEAEQQWADEFTARFAKLVELHSTGWQKVEYEESSLQRWGLGDESIVCGPGEIGESLDSWASIFLARTSLEDVELVREDSDSHREDVERSDRCRRLRATHGLRRRHTLHVEFEECHAPGPERLTVPMPAYRVSGTRDRERVRALSTLESWIDKGLLEAMP